MPIYEYQCNDCGARSEVIQRMSDEPPAECSECGGTIRRLVSAPAVQFKGTGWYVTDYGGRKVSDGSSSAADAKGDSDDKKAKKDKKDKTEKKASSEGSKKTASSGSSD